MPESRRQCRENQANVSAARDVVRNYQDWPPQSAEILSADDVRVAKNLCGGPNQCVVDRKPEPANEFPLRPAWIDIFGAACRWLLQDALNIANGLGIRESGFVKFHVKLFLQRAQQLHAVEGGEAQLLFQVTIGLRAYPSKTF